MQRCFAAGFASYTPARYIRLIWAGNECPKQKAESWVCQIVCAQAPARGGGGSRSRQHACTASMDVGNRAGAIIGRGGVTIRQIQDDSGASLDIQRQDGSDQASVTINADDEESIEKAKQMIADILSGSGGGGGGGGGSYAEPVSMDLGSRHNCFGIIGKGGLKIRELEQKSGARLSVNKDEFTVEIVGTEEAIKSARGLIAAALATLTNASKVTTITLTRDNVGVRANQNTC